MTKCLIVFTCIVIYHFYPPDCRPVVVFTGDGSSYLFWEDNGWPSHPGNKGLLEPRYTAAMALHTAQPQAKLIVLLRNPTDR